MRAFKILVKELKQDNAWGYQDKDEVKHGEIAFDYKGKLDDEIVELKKGDVIYYQYGTNAKIDGEEYVLISLNSIVWQK